MGRYRPPAKPSSKYITPGGYERLREELDYLWRNKRPEVTRAVQEAAAQGDRSENAEYIYGKKQLRQIDSRIHFLKNRLQDMQVVDTVPADTGKVYFGAWVTLESDSGEEQCYRIVGPDEFDLDKKWISMDSPIARNVLGKTLGDRCVIQLPVKTEEYTIVDIVYNQTNSKE